jgi:hypothetical protein
VVDRGILKRALTLLLLAVPVVAALSVELPLCPMAALLGLPCPGCGLTRAALAALHGDFAAALRFHPLVFLAAPAYAFLLGILLWGYVRGTPPKAAPGPSGPAAQTDWAVRFMLGRGTSVLAGVTIALLFVVWVARFCGMFGGPAPVESIRSWRSHVESKVHHVPIAHDVVLAHDGHLAGVAALGLASERH